MSGKQLFKQLTPAVYGLLVYATIRLLQDIDNRSRFWRRPWPVTLAEIGVSLLVGYLLIGLVKIVFRSNDPQMTLGKETGNLFRRELLKVAGITFLIENVILVPFTALTDDGLSWSDLAYINTIPLLYILVYHGITRSRTYFTSYIQHQLLVEKLSNDHLQTELKLLKAQYHPHFLFNALNTIYFQIDADQSGAKQSIELLSSLLRYQLYDQEQMVDIGKELAYLADYIKLQQIRSTGKLQLTMNFDKKLVSQMIYPLLLLPLVENAFKYVGGGYQIFIEAKLRINRLCFKVINDLPPYNLPAEDHKGIGLENLKRRLELLYPENYHLRVQHLQGQFLVELEIPF